MFGAFTNLYYILHFIRKQIKKITYSVTELLVVVTVIGSNVAFLLFNIENYWGEMWVMRIVFSNKQKYNLGQAVWHCFHCHTFNPFKM